MPRSLVLGNGHMLATFDEYLQLRDLYYPYVGMEDHTTFRHFHRVGFWTEGRFSWLNDGSWEIHIQYAEDTLVGNSSAENKNLGIKVHFEDLVYTTSDIFMRKMTIQNTTDRQRDIRVFFSHDIHLYGDKMQDTAQYEPALNAVLHYRKHRYFLISGRWENGSGLDQYTVGKSEYMGKEGTFRDAEDGELQGNAIEQGSVDSTIRFSESFAPGEEKILYQWILAGKKYEELCRSLDRILELSPNNIIEHTRDFWKKWVEKKVLELESVQPEIQSFLKRSLLIIRTQTDKDGAIIAANDSDIMKFNKDTYTYMWPRDGALVSMALSETGYESMVQDFLFFCERIITKDGYVLHKYNPDGSVGSSWHAKIKDGIIQLPIQEDESALILVAMQKYHECFHNIEVIQKLYDTVVLKIGNWMTRFVEGKTGLPLPSYDPWEEHRAISSYTASCTFAGLMAASSLSEETGHFADAKRFLEHAEKIKNAISSHLYSEKDQRFYKSVMVLDGKVIDEDTTVDASLAFLWKMGVFPVDDVRIENTMKAIEREL
ncbi:glycoside hydrolase family 15 protein, partial [Candidatus Peregrinibacteria bacterium]|nr:glycoside hydrolase family 15 protein [Candidatus Peregrinibacteria bacterium]